MAKQKTEIKITGQISTNYDKVEKKYMNSIRIPTGDGYYVQSTVWIPNTPGYSKSPKVVLTFSNSRDKIQILFPGAFDLLEFADVFQRYISSISKDVNAAHVEAVKDYTVFNELLAAQADKRAKEKAEQEFLKQTKNNTNE